MSFRRPLKMSLHLCGRKFELHSFLSKAAYVAYLTFGGVFIEPDVHVTIKVYFIFMQTWLIVFCITGPTLYILRHRNMMSLTSILYLGITVNGDLALCAGQLIFLFYRDQIKMVIKLMDYNYEECVVNRETINVRELLLPITVIGFCIIFGFILPRPIGFTFTNSAGGASKHVFYNFAPLPIDLQDRFNITYTRTYWINTCLTMCPKFYILSITMAAMLTAMIVLLALYNRFIHISKLLRKKVRGGSSGTIDFCAYSWRYVRFIECYQKLRR